VPHRLVIMLIVACPAWSQSDASEQSAAPMATEERIEQTLDQPSRIMGAKATLGEFAGQISSQHKLLDKVKGDLGITAALKPLRFWTNQKRRLKRKVGYESDAGRLLRHGVPKPGGCLILFVIGAAAAGSAAGLIKIAWMQA
jgi:hypothetical protein